MDLTGKNYTEEELIKLIVNLQVSQKHVLCSQKNLSFDFCIDYILNERYSLSDADEYLDIVDVSKSQPHLKERIDLILEQHYKK